MDFGWYGDRDITAATGYLRQRADVDPRRIAAVGLSMGGEEAVGALPADSTLRAVVGEGVTGRTAADKAGWLPHGVAGAVQRGFDRLTYGLTDLLTEARPPISLRSAAAAAPRPLLLIAGGKVADEASAAADIRAGSPARVQVWVVPGAGHTAGLATQPAQWEARVVDFLDRALTP